MYGNVWQCVESITACLETHIHISTQCARNRRPQVLTSCVLNGPHGDVYAVTVAKRNLWHTQVVQASPHARTHDNTYVLDSGRHG